jgi:hypothetical protein
MKDFQATLQAQYINDNMKEIIVVNENSIVETLFQWAKNVDDSNLLRIPSIELVLEE